MKEFTTVRPESAIDETRTPNLGSDAILDNPALCLTITKDGTINSASIGFWDHLGGRFDLPFTQGFNKLNTVFGHHSWPDILEKTKLDGRSEFEAWASRPDGTAERMSVSVDALEPKGTLVPNYFIYSRSCDTVDEAHVALLEGARKDRLTGLFNRHYFEEASIEILEEATETNTTLSLLVLDVDSFKEINDSYGHHFGDNALKYVAKSLTACLPLGETIARYGGDEFVVLLSDLPSENYVVELIDEIRAAVGKPRVVDGVFLKVSVSIGYSVFPRDATTLEGLVRHADKSMYKDKNSRRSGVKLTDKNPRADIGPGRLQKKLHRIFPYYQPIVDLKTEKTVAVEALARLVEATGEVRYPRDFLANAESDGSVVELDRRMFSSVCADLGNPENKIFSDVRVSVNVSATTLNQPDFSHYLLAAMQRYSLSPDKVCIELTESETLMENDPGRQSLFDLSELGFSVALDDFGTGFSSLSVLKDLPISHLKVDKSFIINLEKSRRERRILESILKLCQSIETVSVVEGVETMAQCEILKSMGADQVQGFLFSEAIPIGEIKKSLSKT